MYLQANKNTRMRGNETTQTQDERYITRSVPLHVHPAIRH